MSSGPCAGFASQSKWHWAKAPAPPRASRLHALVGQASACQRPLAGAFFLTETAD